MTTYFSYKVADNNVIADFVVVVKPLTKTSDPDIYISSTLKNPGPDADPKKMTVCSSYGYDLCFYPKEDFKVDDTISIGIYCRRECSYKL